MNATARHEQQITDGTKTRNRWWIKKTFPKDIEEILINNKYKENEINNEEDESDNEGNTF